MSTTITKLFKTKTRGRLLYYQCNQRFSFPPKWYGNLRQFSTRKDAGGRTIKDVSKLSRKERRELKRQQKRLEKRERLETSKQKAQFKSSKQSEPLATPSLPSKAGLWAKDTLTRIFRPKLPGEINATADHTKALAFRLPFWIALCYGLTNDEICPVAIQGGLGPSMLPTMQFFGDYWLVATGAWHRLVGITPKYEVGDIVIWKNPANETASCKRIVGLEGDTVQRYGEHVQLFLDRDDLGIVWPRSSSRHDIEIVPGWDEHDVNGRNTNLSTTEQEKEAMRTITVPEGHVWLEGDAPEFSVDSRHTGPVPIDWIRGRLMLRLWPLFRQDSVNGQIYPCSLDRERPIPFETTDSYLGKRFNFYKIKTTAKTNTNKNVGDDEKNA
jgi:signal peptidase I